MIGNEAWNTTDTDYCVMAFLMGHFTNYLAIAGLFSDAFTSALFEHTMQQIKAFVCYVHWLFLKCWMLSSLGQV